MYGSIHTFREFGHIKPRTPGGGRAPQDAPSSDDDVASSSITFSSFSNSHMCRPIQTQCAPAINPGMLMNNSKQAPDALQQVAPSSYDFDLYTPAVSTKPVIPAPVFNDNILPMLDDIVEDLPMYPSSSTSLYAQEQQPSSPDAVDQLLAAPTTTPLDFTDFSKDLQQPEMSILMNYMNNDALTMPLVMGVNELNPVQSDLSCPSVGYDLIPDPSCNNNSSSMYNTSAFNMEPVDLKPKIEKTKAKRLCQFEGCQKRSRSMGFCISHGGGKRCYIEGCDKSAQGGDFCIRHGGGRRCQFPGGCTKSAQGPNNRCKAHGGGPRCKVPGCEKSSQGSDFCRAHGGGKRCIALNCNKGAQRGSFCAVHGGSKLCSVPNCHRNDRGGGLCASHGGGRRCTMDGCNKPCRRKVFVLFTARTKNCSRCVREAFANKLRHGRRHKMMIAFAKASLKRFTRRTNTTTQVAYCSSNTTTTYSGGHPSEGQGGFYGSLESRSELSSEFVRGSRAEKEDIILLNELMDRVSKLPDVDANFSSTIKDDTKAQALLSRLNVNGSPAWGLTRHQRDFVTKWL